MKIECNLQNVYCFDNSENEELEFDGYQVEYEYRLIDNDVDIRLGVLAFHNGQYNYNYEAEADLWSLYEDASEGIVETIYGEITLDNIDDYLDDILEEINDNTTKLKAYLDNDKDKLKKILILLCKKFIKNEPTYKFAKKNVTKKYFF